MSYRQPRVPQMRGDDIEGFLRELMLFLRDDCMAGWNADRRRDEELAAIRRRLDALEGKGG